MSNETKIQVVIVREQKSTELRQELSNDSGKVKSASPSRPLYQDCTILWIGM